MATKVLQDVLELAELERETWAAVSARIAASGVLRCEDDGDGDGGADDGDKGDGGGAADDGDKGDAEDEPDWKTHARKHERRAKAEKSRADKVQAELDELRKGQQTDHEKALEEARKEAREAALSEAEKERRSDRLEVAVTRLAAKTFADTEDALTNIERAIARGDLDTDDIFDDQGKVQTKALETALGELLERKPHLAVSQDTGGKVGGADAGKGGGKTASDLSVEEHLGQIRRHK